MGETSSKMVADTVSQTLEEFARQAGKHSYGPAAIVALMSLFVASGCAGGVAGALVFGLAMVCCVVMVQSWVPSVTLDDGTGRTSHIRGQELAPLIQHVGNLAPLMAGGPQNARITAGSKR